MRSFYRAYGPEIIYATLSRKSMGVEVSSEKYATLSRISEDQVRKKKEELARTRKALDAREEAGKDSKLS